MPNQGSWQSYTESNAPEVVQQQMRAEAAVEPAATIEIKIFGTGPGQSSISIKVAQAGPFAAVQQSSKSAQIRSADQLYQVVSRELGNGLRTIAS